MKMFSRKRLLLSAIFIGLIAVFVLVFLKDSIHASCYYLRARLYDSRGQVDRAEEMLTQAIAYDRNYALAYVMRSAIYLDKGSNRQVVADGEKALGLLPSYDRRNRFAVFFNMGTAWLRLEDYSKALQFLDRAIEIDPENANAYMQRSLAHYKQSNYQAALKELDVAIRLNPDYYELYYRKGLILLALEQPDGALQAFTEALNYNNKYSDAYYNRGCLWWSKKEYGKALSDLSRAVELSPEDLDYRKNRGLCYYESGQRDLAINDLTEVVDRTDDIDAEAQSVLAVLYWQKNRRAEAIELLEKAIPHVEDPLRKAKCDRLLSEYKAAYVAEDADQ